MQNVTHPHSERVLGLGVEELWQPVRGEGHELVLGEVVALVLVLDEVAVEDPPLQVGEVALLEVLLLDGLQGLVDRLGGEAGVEGAGGPLVENGEAVPVEGVRGQVEDVDRVPYRLELTSRLFERDEQFVKVCLAG